VHIILNARRIGGNLRKDNLKNHYGKQGAYMRLEIISRYPDGETKSLPLLFVHGSFAGAEIWDEYFLPYFAAQGYQVHALSLRGHGASEGREHLPWWGLADYVADLKHSVQKLPRAPVLIGHSMGGMVVQKYLESQPAAGAVLMASVPPHGLLPSLLGMAVGNPPLLYQILLLQSLGPRFITLDVLRRALFSDNTPDAQLLAYVRMLQAESHRVTWDMLGLNPLRLNGKPRIPMLVIGAGQDAFISTSLVRETARYYGADSVSFPDLAHAMMLEANWRQVADYLLDWLDKCFSTIVSSLLPRERLGRGENRPAEEVRSQTPSRSPPSSQTPS
jgi:pimeloyl-ACP methyl ester carboxylesterase